MNLQFKNLGFRNWYRVSLLLLMRSLIESTIKWRFDFFEACMIVMKGYLIDIEDPDDRNFRKK